ncbi:MAG: hypothetical protein HC872_08955 [Gammaproteobacteria bacterium]|nr:hypothetical protein [Gammaproteobacteria bacterium]
MAARIQAWKPELYSWINMKGHNHPVDFEHPHGHEHGDVPHHHGDGAVGHTHKRKRRRK